jgi:hypothetical protein
MAKKPAPAPTTPAKPNLAADIRIVLDTIPDGPYWATYADVCLALGRPVSNALAVASAAAKVTGFMRWDQVRNAEGVFRAMKGTDGAEGRIDGKVRHDAATIARWAKARGLSVGANGRAAKSQRVTWRDGVWVTLDGTAVSAKPRKARAARKAAPAAAPVAAPADAPIVDAPVVEVPVEEVVAS